MSLGVIAKNYLERRESKTVPWMECSIIKRLGRRVEISSRRLKRNYQQGRKKTKRAQCPGSQVKKVHQGRESEGWELTIENWPLYRSLVILIRQFGWGGGGQSLIRTGIKNSLTAALWESTFSLFKSILRIIAPNYLRKSQIRSCDSLAYFSEAPNCLKN